MTKSKFTACMEQAINQTWNRESASANLDRWLTICKQENWLNCPENIGLLTKVFGASWYFTRYVYFRGKDAAAHIDNSELPDLGSDAIKRELTRNLQEGDLDDSFNQLRIKKNEIMFQIFLAGLNGKLNQEQQETALTRLAEKTLFSALELILESQIEMDMVSILAMGRMAGGEMNYGSDLDLIFLYEKESGDSQPVLTRRIQSLLRNIAIPTPFGILYEIDMRLRPHGTSGTLISPVEYFIDYHQGQREIWERQMMTRCRPIIDKSGFAGAAIDRINQNIYSNYEQESLKSDILFMRNKVQQELGKPGGKYEIKRGYGGIMDIDFLTHYLQLLHGHQYIELRTPSTRNALRKLCELNILSGQITGELLEAYDFLKKIEGVLRVKEMKSISTFSRDPDEPGNIILARAMGFQQEKTKKSVTDFLDKYTNVTKLVRNHFESIVGDVSGLS